MVLEISKSDLKHIKYALYLAIQWQDSLINAHTTKLNKDLSYTIPKEFKKDTDKMKRDISNFKLIRNKI